MNKAAVTNDARWPARTWLLAAIGGVCGLLIWLLADTFPDKAYVPGVPATCIFLAGFAAILAFTLAQVRIVWSIAFSIVVALVPALTFYWVYDLPGSTALWPMACALLATAIALPIFLTVRDEGHWSLPYPLLHRHAWTSAVICIGALVFGSIVASLLALWAGLFDLIGIDFFVKLFTKAWFIAIIIGSVGAGAVSLLRDWSQVMSAMQRMVMAVLSILAPVLGLALVMFLGTLPVVGLAKLWEATDSTTPLLLSGLLWALLFANAVLADSDAHETRSLVLRAGAMALGASLLPLAGLAAAATYLRIDQHGLTPERIWAVIFVGFALLYGLVYLAALLRRRQHWASDVRRGNIVLAFLIAGVALFLATPILDFQTISANDQIARLLKGKIAPDKFDYAALKFDLGEPGKRALARLRTLRDHPQAAVIRAQVAYVDKFDSRWDMPQSSQAQDQQRREAEARLAKLIIRPQGATIPAKLRALLLDRTDLYGCVQEGSRCLLLFVQLVGDAQPEAVLLKQSCPDCGVEIPIVYLERLQDWRWVDTYSTVAANPETVAEDKAMFDAILAGRFELRPEVRQRLYVNGKEVQLPAL